ncbi:DnaJ domain-containing protein [Boletus edulis BED1]|uniref:DnaJ domain-containing protein n=1 Tax=Boletus edulis BED1 TaxID=1328754 RepID=A0AAD4GIR0_BOLED|nr:DnaJ domain-containing protein [Boletus edulis BED1]
MSAFPDYYSILGIQKSASSEEIKQAYRKESLRTHPDRLTKATNAEKKSATEKFQAVADAYYVLSDPIRRKEYDSLYSSKSQTDKSADPKASSNFFHQFASMFGNAGTGNTSRDNGHEQRPDAQNVFADVFDELLRPEVERHTPWWSYLGTVCGGGVGFIVANVPGLVLGAFTGNRIGAVRDAKGKSVAAVFGELGATQKAEILRALAMKVLGSAL